MYHPVALIAGQQSIVLIGREVDLYQKYLTKQLTKIFHHFSTISNQFNFNNNFEAPDNDHIGRNM
jgi:hypothetical protein